MSRKHTAAQVETGIQKNRPFIKLDHSTYINTHIKARFIDDVFGEWFAYPCHVTRGTNHPARAGNRKYTPEEIEMSIQQNRPYISLDYSTYKNVATKAKFIDAVYGEWWAKPADVVRGRNKKQRGYLKIRLSDEEILQRLLTRKDIYFDISTYTIITKKARFIDKELGDFWAHPRSVFKGAQHPDKRINRLLSAQEVELRIQATRPWISLNATTYVNTHTPAEFIDDIYGSWWPIPNNLLTHKCNHPKRVNKVTDIEKLIQDIFGIEKYDKVPSFLKKEKGHRYKPDFKLTEDIYLDCDGLYWHCDICRSKNHHKVRREVFEKYNKSLLQIRSDEILNKKETVVSIIRSKLGQNIKIHNHNYQTVPIAGAFFQENHLAGEFLGKCVGVVQDGVVVYGIGYYRDRKNISIERFANKNGYTVENGFEYLLKAILVQEKGISKVTVPIDLRYGTGDFLEGLGFNLAKINVGFKWTDLVNTFVSSRCVDNMDYRMLSEAQHAEELRWYKIHDAGQAQYVLKLPEMS